MSGTASPLGMGGCYGSSCALEQGGVSKKKLTFAPLCLLLDHFVLLFFLESLDRAGAACKSTCSHLLLAVRKALGASLRQALLESVLFPNHTLSHPHAAVRMSLLCVPTRSIPARSPAGPRGNVCKEELLAPHTRLCFLPFPQVLFLIPFSSGVCHKSQRAQANVGVSAEHQPTVELCRPPAQWDNPPLFN